MTNVKLVTLIPSNQYSSAKEFKRKIDGVYKIENNSVNVSTKRTIKVEVVRVLTEGLASYMCLPRKSLKSRCLVVNIGCSISDCYLMDTSTNSIVFSETINKGSRILIKRITNDISQNGLVYDDKTTELMLINKNKKLESSNIEKAIEETVLKFTINFKLDMWEIFHMQTRKILQFYFVVELAL